MSIVTPWWPAVESNIRVDRRGSDEGNPSPLRAKGLERTWRDRLTESVGYHRSPWKPPASTGSPCTTRSRDRFAELWLCNAQHVKERSWSKDRPQRRRVARRCRGARDGPSSFVSATEIRQLRELTRYRKTQVDMRTQQIQRLAKVLRRCRHQAQFGGVGSVVPVIEADHRGHDRRRARSGGSRPDGQESDARKDPPT